MMMKALVSGFSTRAEKRKLRMEYHKSKESMIDIIKQKIEEGASIEEMVRAIYDNSSLRMPL